MAFNARDAIAYGVRNPERRRAFRAIDRNLRPEVAGDSWFVDSAKTSAGDGKTWDQALLTIGAALDKCTANNGDRIYVGPQHAETLSAANAVDIDVAGVHIIGCGWGEIRPIFNASATGGTFRINANNVIIENLLFKGGIDVTTGLLRVNGKTDCQILDCCFRDVTGQATDVLIAADGSDRLLIDGWIHQGAAAAGANSALALDGCDDVVVRNCQIYGNFAVGAIDFRTTLSARMWVHDCIIWTANAADIAVVDTITSSTGFIGPNILAMVADNAANITETVTAATCQMIPPIYVCNLAGEIAMATNITASTDA